MVQYLCLQKYFLRSYIGCYIIYIYPNKSLESKLMSMEMDFLRRSARCSRLEKIRNNVIREKMNIKNSVLYYIRYKEFNWYGHV